MIRIRSFRDGDLDALYDVCLRTGDAGEDARAMFLDPHLLGHVYAGPYARFSPATAFVVEDGAGIGGYIVGPADTVAFEDALERDWWPALRLKYADSPAPRTADERMRRHVHHPRRARPEIAGAFPAHLHVNLLPSLRGQGVGRRLLDVWCETVAALGAGGAHLEVGTRNARAVRFYRANGFREIARAGEVLTLARPIRDSSRAWTTDRAKVFSFRRRPSSGRAP